MMKNLLVILLLLCAAAVFADTPLVREDVEDDGQCVTADIAGRPADVLADKPEMRYMYFRLPDKENIPEDPCLEIDYYAEKDCGVGVQYNSVRNDHYYGGGFRCLRGAWQKAYVPLPGFEPKGAMHEDCDVRLEINDWRLDSFMPKNPVYIGSVVLTSRKDIPEPVYPKLKQDKYPIEYIIGVDLNDITAAIYEDMGINKVQSYVTWEQIEKGPGVYDWSYWDNQARIMKEWGLRWQVFIIIGPSVSLPEWFRNSPDHKRAVCLEHGTQTEIESVWNKDFEKYIRSFLQAFYDHYSKSGVLESMELGIQGDFGETIYPYWGGGWTGDYHTHPGYWCGDDMARADFARAMKEKYTDVSAMNKAWGTDFGSFEDNLMPFENEEEKTEWFAALKAGRNRVRWFDFIDWYRGSMVKLADFWLKTTKEIYRGMPIYLGVGGHSAPEQGCLHSLISKTAADNGAGIRITNEMSEYTFNVAGTRLVSDTCRLLNAPFAFEPGDKVDSEKGITCRAFNTITCGADQLYDYTHNVIHSAEQVKATEEAMPMLKDKYTPVRDVALWYPDRDLCIEHDDYYWRIIPAVRRLADMTIVDSVTVPEGALENIKVLVLADASVFESADVRYLTDFAAKGGRILAVECGDFVYPDGTAAVSLEKIVTRTDWQHISGLINEKLKQENRALYGSVMNMFVCQVGENKFLIYNQNPYEASVTVHLGDKKQLCTVPGYKTKEFVIE